MRRYETIFILRPDLGETQVKQSLKRVEDIVANGGGELIETDEWGVRELAYRIRRERRGYYVRLDYVSTAAVMNEIERNLKLMDESLRHLSVMVQEEADAAQLRSEVEARQRRLAEARVAAAAGSEQASEAKPSAQEAGEGSASGEEAVAASAAQSGEVAQSEESAPQAEEAGNGAGQN